MELDNFGPIACTRSSAYFQAVKAVVLTIRDATIDHEPLIVMDCERQLTRAGYYIPLWRNDQNFMDQFENANPNRFEGPETWGYLHALAKNREEENEYYAQIVLRKNRNRKRTV